MSNELLDKQIASIHNLAFFARLIRTAREEIKKEIRKFALQNAIEHEGQTRDKTILAKILGSIPELRQKVQEISPVIVEIVSEINQIPLEQQKKEIKSRKTTTNSFFTTGPF